MLYYDLLIHFNRFSKNNKKFMKRKIKLVVIFYKKLNN